MANEKDIVESPKSTAQIELHGTHEFKVDSKGRLTLPAKFRKVLPPDLVVTLDPLNEYLMAFTPAGFSEWAKKFVEDATGEFMTNNKKQLDLRRRIMSRADDVEVDSAGRITLKANMRKAAGIEKNVVVIGNDNYFEIWAEERLEQSENLDIDGAFSESLAEFMN